MTLLEYYQFYACLWYSSRILFHTWSISNSLFINSSLPLQKLQVWAADFHTSHKHRLAVLSLFCHPRLPLGSQLLKSHLDPVLPSVSWLLTIVLRFSQDNCSPTMATAINPFSLSDHIRTKNLLMIRHGLLMVGTSSRNLAEARH